ncbi:MAG: cob(I)yrinic acid a,c-diamide adenosyltransferase [Sideroxydans sp.]|nr:cob(I)yrinic acid a,c-diamide adenosyltransferase [Sideroxydans sp.]
MRLSKITTRTGDNGTTGLADGSRLPKDDPRIAAIGSVDELNSQLGLLLTESLPEAVRRELLDIQQELFDLGGVLAVPGALFDEAKLAKLDTAIVRFNADLPPLREFILPGGNRAAALCHVARCIARRAEREYVPLARADLAPIHGLQYLNRLSDLLFILCRVLNRTAGQAETLWSRS